jgi:ADP-ribosylglycohydrolase
MARDPLHERIAGNLMAAALGDALGTPTEGCSRAEITQRYGGLVRGFQPCAVEASAVGAVGLRPGEVTDDTSQLLAVARALIACDGELDAARWTAVLRDWLLTSPKARLAGPSTRRLLHSGKEHPSGWVDDATVGATNGAAMRVAPAGWSARAMSSAPSDWRECAASRPTTPRSPQRPPVPSLAASRWR